MTIMPAQTAEEKAHAKTVDAAAKASVAAATADEDARVAAEAAARAEEERLAKIAAVEGRASDQAMAAMVMREEHGVVSANAWGEVGGDA